LQVLPNESYSKNIVKQYVYLKNCEYVDEVVPYVTDNGLETILSALKIDINIISDEFKDKDFSGRAYCEENGIELYFFDSKVTAAKTEPNQDNPKKQTVTHVVLTGGVGSRLWPLSRKSQPKQYLDLFEGKSLFEMTVERNAHLVDQVMVVGNVDNCHLSKKVMDKLTDSYINIVESTPRNTAAAIAFAAFASDPDTILIVTPSDHIIEDQDLYDLAIAEAIEKAANGFITTFGIVPTKPETGYGYIERKGDDVVSFREKPNQVVATEFIAKGNFLWNSGMFCFKASVLLEELKAFEREVYAASKKAWETNSNGILDLEQSLAIPSISIDYAVMERSKKIKVVSSAFDWSDLGSFESIYDYLVSKGHPVDKNGNMVIGTNLYSAFLGLENTIFVSTPTANLILQKEQSQDVKYIYNQLELEQSHLLN
jgi:mannose-1-phosphate guanylyltransferase